MNGSNDKIAISTGGHLKQDRSRDRNEDRGQQIFENVMPRRGRHVHVLIAMMQQVHLPEDFAAMVEAMLPVLQKVPDESSDQHGEQAAAHALEAERGQIYQAEGRFEWHRRRPPQRRA